MPLSSASREALALLRNVTLIGTVVGELGCNHAASTPMPRS